MTVTSPRRPSRLAYLLVWSLVVGVAVLALWILKVQHRATVDDLIHQQRLAQQLSWQALQTQQSSNVSAYFDLHVMHPDTLAWLRLAQDPDARDRARRGLERELTPVYEQLRARGINHFHFHLPDGESLLRFHQPDQYGDSLAERRESVRLANERLQSVSGFELSRLDFAHRSVFPILDEEDRHLGSVELSMHYGALLRQLHSLWPGHDFELILRRDLLRDAPLENRERFRQIWPGSEHFAVNSSHDPVGRDSAEPAVGPDTLRLLNLLAADPALRSRVEAAQPDVYRLALSGRDYVVTQTPVTDPAGRTLGLVMSYAPEPALARLDAGFRLNAALAIGALLVLGIIVHGLLTIAADKFGERQRLGLITRSLGQGLYVLDAEGLITEVNPRACALLGYPADELIGKRAHEVFHSHRENQFLREDVCPILSSTARGERFTGEQRFRRKDGTIIDVSVTSVPMEDMGGSVTLFDDITRQKNNERQLKHIAHYDALTGLPNRVLLADRLSLAMAQTRRFRTRLALAFIDLDGFKAVNDTHGHEVGDRLLVRLARRMQSSLRETDTVARLGGDEFAVVLNDISDPSSYGMLLDRLLVAIAQPEIIEGHELQVSASIGVSLYPQGEDIDADQLLRQADQAMYEAKLAGKNRYRVFDVARDTDLRGRHEQIERLRQGLENNELRLYFQPRVNLRTGKVHGAEALIRWQHPQRGLLSPAEFLPLIDRHPLEVEIGRWVLDAALKQMDYWQRHGLEMPVSINVAGEHLQRPSFADELAEALAAWPRLPPEHLQLEVIESSALEDIGAVSSVIDACTRLGVSVALDDFGTGYSSLTYLKRLPIRTLKLDQSFVRDMLHDPDDLAILDGVLNLARAFGLEPVAEGVETMEHGRILLQLGCELAQGYAIARPMPASGVQPWLERWRVPADWSRIKRLDSDGREALYAQVELRAWMRHVEAYLDEARGPYPEPPPVRKRLLRLAGQRATTDDHSEHAVGLGESLQRLHDLARELVDIRQRQGRYSALGRLEELNALHAEVQDLLERLIRT